MAKRDTGSAAVAICIALCCSVLAGCAGDLGAAKDAAGKAATFAGDMQQTTLSAIDDQRAYRQNELDRTSELQVSGQMSMAQVNQYPSTWAAANLKDAAEIYKAITGIMPDDDLRKTAPFVVMSTPSEFSAPAIDRKAFTDLISKFNKLSEGLSPADRATALKPFIEVVVKSFGDSVKAAKKSADTALAAKTAPVAAGLGDAPAVSVEGQTTNETAVNGVIAALGH